MKIPPPRLKLFFAKKAPVCVIIRRGPSRYSQMVIWNTETDEITEGQWVRGKVDFLTLNSTGTHAALGIMGGRARTPYEDQYAIFCRPPYFTALEVYVRGLCYTWTAFLPNDQVVRSGGFDAGRTKGYATSKCPFTEPVITDYSEVSRDHRWVIDGANQVGIGKDHRGRKVIVDSGCIYIEEGETRRLVYDASQTRFSEVVAPDWAKDW